MSDNIFDRSCVEIDLDALKHNFEEIKKAVTPGTDILAVVKADAYGHGALETAKTLIDGGDPDRRRRGRSLPCYD